VTFPNAGAGEWWHHRGVAVGAIWLLGVSLMSAATLGVATHGHTLSYADARSALRAVGVTKVFTIGGFDATGETITVTGGPIAAQPLIVRVFSNAKALHSFMRKYPPPPTAVLHAVFPHAGGYLPTRIVCNAFVSSTILPYLNTSHPTARDRRLLGELLAKIAADQARVVQNLQHRCLG
jgi:hypothetical protein